VDREVWKSARVEGVMRKVVQDDKREATESAGSDARARIEGGGGGDIGPRVICCKEGLWRGEYTIFIYISGVIWG